MSPLAIATPDDARGMRTLQELLGGDPVAAAALALLACRRRLVVATGFPVGGRPETDGPPGAIALCRALARLGCGDGVALVSWRAVLDLMDEELPPEVARVEIPLPPRRGPRVEGAAIAIECCGTLPDGTRRNMRGEDVRAVAPCFEDVLGDVILMAMGDGGNEVGMGAAPAAWRARFPVPAPRSRAEILVPASVSNWAALAVVAALSVLTRAPLLPPAAEHAGLIERLVGRGAVDGFTGRAEPLVDGRPASDEAAVLASLRAWVAARAGESS